MGSTPSNIQFGTDGWRAVIADTFTFENVQLVAQAIAQYVIETKGKSKPILLGYDGRFLADHFAAKAGETLRKNGLNVLIVKQYTPTPIVAFGAQYFDTAGALMFTASHNPPEYMGIKFIPEYAGPATPEITDTIVATVHALQAQGWHSDPTAKMAGTMETVDPTEAYIEFLGQSINFDLLKKNPLKLLYDPMYGAGYGYLNRIFQERIGYTPDMIHDRIDPRFGGQLPEPKDEYLEELMEKVVKNGYQLGLANDGDADRFGIIDDQGHYISNNFIMPLLIRYLYHQRNFRGAGVRTIATSAMMNALADKLDFPVYETKVGFKHVGEIMRREPVMVGGEESGGLSILNHIPEKDGLLGALLVCEMVAAEQKPLSQIFKDLEAEAGFKTHYVHTNLHLNDDEKASLMANMRQIKAGDVLGGKTVIDVDTTDGIKVIFSRMTGQRTEWVSEWLQVRPSGTEPIIRLYGESQDAAFGDQFETIARGYIKTPQPV